MTTLALYQTIRQRGGEFRVNGNTLKIQPAGLVSDLRDAILEQKHALLALLSNPAGIPGEVRRFDAGAAYREFQANPPKADDFADQVPPALIERPGETLRDDGVWFTSDGFKVITPGTMPALRKAQRAEFAR